MLHAYWRVVEPPKSAAEVRAEASLFFIHLGGDVYWCAFAVPFQRWMLFLAAFVSQICCGSLYAYGLLTDAVATHFGLSPEAATLPFYVAYGSVGLAAVFAGPFVERHGPRVAMYLGTALMALGHTCAAVAVAYKAPALLHGYGVLYGAGIGVNYIAPVAPLQKWFPDLRGTAAGFALCGFGASGVVWGGLYQVLLVDLGIGGVFWRVGLTTTVLLVVCAAVLRTPPPSYRVHGLDMHGAPEALLEDIAIVDFAKATDYLGPELDPIERVYHDRIQHLSLAECIVSIDFLFVCLTYLATFVFGILFLPRFFDVYKLLYDPPEYAAINFMLCCAGCNFLGRLVVPMASDAAIRLLSLNPAFARKAVFAIAIVWQCIALGILPSTVRDPLAAGVFRGLIWTTAFLVGGATGVVPSLCTDLYGVYNTGTMFGCLLTCSSLTGLVGGAAFTHYFGCWRTSYGLVEAYAMSLHRIHGIVLSGLLFVCLVRTNPVDRFQIGYSACWWRRR
ncbi:Major Facilitator Superfamily (MFS) [Achlya hypogyna]|uniref:Major Facilitator Superfamily (MFS) n=1 Tax=Achlya hypogyna TaxID=1202772 RepID=A0A1V9Z4L9_ACHHY|nr:Major Facilitator Superfamily (MFS) [Achlya hypogyna]